MTRAHMQILGAMLLVGAAVRLILAFTASGVDFDIRSHELAGRALLDVKLGLYRQLIEGREGAILLRWPYPPGSTRGPLSHLPSGTSQAFPLRP